MMRMIRFKRLERRATGRIILFRKSHIVVVMVTYFIPRILIFSKPWVLLSHNIILFRVAHISKRKNHELAIPHRTKYFYITIVQLYVSIYHTLHCSKQLDAFCRTEDVCTVFVAQYRLMFYD